MAGRTEITTDFSSGSKNSAADWFTDVVCPVTGTIVVSMIVGTSCVPQLTRDGTNFYNLNGGQPIAADSRYSFEVTVKQADTINLTQSSGSAVTVRDVRLYH